MQSDALTTMRTFSASKREPLKRYEPKNLCVKKHQPDCTENGARKMEAVANTCTTEPLEIHCFAHVDYLYFRVYIFTSIHTILILKHSNTETKCRVRTAHTVMAKCDRTVQTVCGA
jgi:hypothetical protein